MTNYTLDERALIFLSRFDFISHKKYVDILNAIKEPHKLFTLNGEQRLEVKSILKNYYEEFIDSLSNYNERVFFDTLDKRNIKCLTILSDDYPNNLKRLAQPPFVLYYVGNIKLLKTNIVAMVGTRTPSTYGKLITERFSKALAKKGITIVSGLASGVDKLSHEGALDANGNTIAVLGGGFDHIFPAMNINLARDIAQKGLVITEYFLTTKPTKYSFPARNRIIAGLSDAILITEAGKKSGSLYTMEFGAEIGVETYCVPGNVTSDLSYATNDLIKNGMCACATSPDDIMYHFGIKPDKEKPVVKKQREQQLSLEENVICNLLRDGEKDFDFLQEKTGYSTQSLNINLTSLEISGIIKKLAGNSFILC